MNNARGLAAYAMNQLSTPQNKGEPPSILMQRAISLSLRIESHCFRPAAGCLIKVFLKSCFEQM